jgi:hypothetical protein
MMYPPFTAHGVFLRLPTFDNLLPPTDTLRVVRIILPFHDIRPNHRGSRFMDIPFHDMRNVVAAKSAPAA